MASRTDYEIFDLGDFTLSGGATLRGARLAYKTYGTLSENRDNAIVYPTWYSGRHWENEWLIGDGMALDPARYFIIVPNMLGNGLSSSPSNTSPPYNGPRFPDVRVQDNVRAQHQLVTERFGIERLVAVTGWSMGAGRPTSGRSAIRRWCRASCRSAARRGPAGTTSSSSKGSRRRSPPTRLGRAAGTTSSPGAGCAPPRASTPAGVSRRPSTGIGLRAAGLHVA